jgi:hypothetical protein
LVFFVDAEKDYLGCYTLPTKYSRKVDRNFWIIKKDFFIFLIKNKHCHVSNLLLYYFDGIMKEI